MTLRATPEHGLVILKVAVGILQSNLSLADTPEPTDGLWPGEHCCLIFLEPSTQAREDILTSNKEGVAWVGDIPDGWQHSTRSTHRKEGEILNGPTKTSSHVCEGFVPILPSGDGLSISW